MDRGYDVRSPEERVRLFGGGPRRLLPQGGGVVARPNPILTAKVIRPSPQQAVEFEPQVVMKSGGVVFLD